VVNVIITLVNKDKKRRHLCTRSNPVNVPATNDLVVVMTKTGMSFYVVVQRKHIYKTNEYNGDSVIVLVREATEQERNGY